MRTASPQDVDSDDVNAYLQEITAEDFTAKDFRTWHGTVLAAIALQEVEQFDTKAKAKKNLVSAIESVAQRLGNTPAVCRKCYVHPAIIEAYMNGEALKVFKERADHELKHSLHQLTPEEAAVLALLQQSLARQTDKNFLRKQLAASIKAQRKLAQAA
jgi:DNA topoisomerase-1